MPDASHVIFDTEYATDEGARDSDWGCLGHHREIIRIGAARIVPGQPWESFETLDLLVNPVFAAHTAYTEQITGITQEMLDVDGCDAERAFRQLYMFIDGLPALSNGNDINKIAETAGLQGFVMPFDPLEFGSVLKPMYRELAKHVAPELPERPWVNHSSGTLHRLVGIDLPEGLGEVHNPLRNVWSIHVTLEALHERYNADVVSEVLDGMAKRKSAFNYHYMRMDD